MGVREALGARVFRLAGSRGQQVRVTLSHEERALLVGGIDLDSTRKRRWYRKAGTVEEKSCKPENVLAS